MSAILFGMIQKLMLFSTGFNPPTSLAVTISEKYWWLWPGQMILMDDSVSQTLNGALYPKQESCAPRKVLMLICGTALAYVLLLVPLQDRSATEISSYTFNKSSMPWPGSIWPSASYVVVSSLVEMKKISNTTQFFLVMLQVMYDVYTYHETDPCRNRTNPISQTTSTPKPSGPPRKDFIYAVPCRYPNSGQLFRTAWSAVERRRENSQASLISSFFIPMWTLAWCHVIFGQVQIRVQMFRPYIPSWWSLCCRKVKIFHLLGWFTFWPIFIHLPVRNIWSFSKCSSETFSVTFWAHCLSVFI